MAMPFTGTFPGAPTLTDGDVTIRMPGGQDVEGSFEQCQDPQVQRWTTIPIPYRRDDARDYLLEFIPKGWETGQEWGFVVEVGSMYAGTISLRDEGDRRANIGFGAHPWVRATGRMERALRLMLDWGFVEKDLHTVVWSAHTGNWASRKLAWRLGFSFEGTLRGYLPHRGELRDAWIGTLLRDDDRTPKGTWLDVPVLEGDGLRLRPFAERDIPRIVEACSDERTQHWLAELPRPYGANDAGRYLESVTEKLATGAGITWAVVDPAEDDLLGSMSLFDYTPGRECEVGYWAHPAARGTGVTTRATGLAVRYAAEQLGVRRVTAYSSADNAASRHVIESNGFRHHGTGRLEARHGDGTEVDLVGYDLLAEEFRSRA